MFAKEEKGAHNPIYSICKVLLDDELLYPILEKLPLAVVTGEKLYPYFEAHTLIVLNSYPIRG